LKDGSAISILAKSFPLTIEFGADTLINYQVEHSVLTPAQITSKRISKLVSN